MKPLIAEAIGYIYSGKNCSNTIDEKVLTQLIQNSDKEIAHFFEFSQKAKKLKNIYSANGRLSIFDGIFVKSYAIHARDLDEMSYSIGGHPMATLYPVFLHLSPNRQDYSALLKSLQIEIALGKVLNPFLYDGRYHPTTIIGIIGSTLISSFYLKLTREESINAVGIAVSFMAGVRDNFGSDAKALQVANATRSGFHAAMLASEGFTSNTSQIDCRNTLEIFTNSKIDSSVVKQFSKSLNDHIDLSDEFLYKKYGVCGSFHDLVDLALSDSRHQHSPKAEEIESLFLYIHPDRLNNQQIKPPVTRLEKRFSPSFLYSYAFSMKNTKDMLVDDKIPKKVAILMSKVVIVPDNSLGKWNYASKIHVLKSSEPMLQISNTT